MFLAQDHAIAVHDEDGNWIIRFPLSEVDRWLTKVIVHGGPGNSTISVVIEGQPTLSTIDTGPDNAFTLPPGAALIAAGLQVFVRWNRGTGPAPTGDLQTEFASSRGWQELEATR